MPAIAPRELVVLDYPPDSPENRSIKNFWFLNVAKHCIQAVNNGTSYSSSPAQNALLVPPDKYCLSTGRQRNVMLGFLWGALFSSLLAMIALGMLRHLRRTRTIRQTRNNFKKQPVDEEVVVTTEKLEGKKMVVSTPVVLTGIVSEEVRPDRLGRRIKWASGF